MNEDIRADAPVLDEEAMARDIAKRTGIDLRTVRLVLDAELDHLIRVGIASPPDDAGGR